MSVLAPSVGILWRVIESYGLDPDPLFRAEGLELAWPLPAGARLPYDQVDAVRARAVEATGDPAMGLRIADCAHPSQLGALGYAVLASTTLREAFERMRRYVRVLNDQGHIALEEDGDALILWLSVAQPSRMQRVREDAQMAFVLSLCRMNVGPGFQPRWVAFRHEAPSNLAPYETLFRCPLRFGTEHNGIAVDRQAADRPLPSANPVLASMSERIVDQRLAKLDRDNVLGRVRGVMMEQLPSGRITDESVAEALHMTPRTLHRKLRVEGESFRSLLTTLRQDLARQYIADETLTLTEITFLLGFSEMSSFSRAFKNWNGVAPSVARAGA